MKKLFLFSFLFILLYLEPLNFLGLKFSHIWKIILIFIFIQIFLKKKIYFNFFKLYFFYGISLIVTPFFIEYPLEILTQSIKYLFFPFMMSFLLYNRNYNYINKEMLSAFVIISFLPFYFNILPQLGTSYELEDMGFEINDALSGIFQQPHEASLSLSLSIITLTYALVNEKKFLNKILFSALIVVGIFFLIKTYVRLGIFMFLISLFFIFFYKTKLVLKTKFLFIFVATAILSVTYLINNSSTQIVTFTARLLGQTAYSSGSDIDSDIVSSGRLTIWESSIESWKEDGDISVITLGLSEPELIKRNKQKIGKAVFSHNEFINALATGGFISLFIFLGFFFFWFKKINILKNKNFDIQYYKYALIIFVNYFLFCLLQGGPISVIAGAFILFSLVPLFQLKTNKLNI